MGCFCSMTTISEPRPYKAVVRQLIRVSVSLIAGFSSDDDCLPSSFFAILVLDDPTAGNSSGTGFGIRFDTVQGGDETRQKCGQRRVPLFNIRSRFTRRRTTNANAGSHPRIK